MSCVISVDPLIKALATAQGLDTNVWIIGVEELINRIELLINELIKQLGASEGTVFDAIGLSISGGSQKKMADRIKSALKVVHCNLRFRVYILSFCLFKVKDCESVCSIQ